MTPTPRPPPLVRTTARVPAARARFVDRTGNIVADDADVLVNTVNVRGPRGPTMGKGVALDFARRWPAILEPYRNECRRGLLVEGRCRLMDLPGEAPGLFDAPRARRWAAFATKGDWREPSRYEWIASGLADLAAALLAEGHASVAMPPLGCGYGGLDWKRVRPMVERALCGLDIEVRLPSASIP